jgi:serine/threonine protein kinase
MNKKQLIIDNRYVIQQRIGKGSFGEVFIGMDNVTNTAIAIKMENKDKKHILAHEYEIYKELMSSKAAEQHKFKIPKIYWYGNIDEKRAIVMEYLGNSLEYLLQQKCYGKFTLKTTLMLGIQMFKQLKNLHENNFVHRDIKPENFLMGAGGGRSYVYLIDFGLAKRYKSKEHVHIKCNADKKLIGTARYASVNSHIGTELSRRDDLESLVYLLIYFLKGSLPWQGINISDREEKYAKIGELKATISADKLCEGTPVELCNFLNHIKKLGFKDKPDYKYLYAQLVHAFNRVGYCFDYIYDWDETTEAIVYPPASTPAAAE